jgi:hypothetical protein
MDALRKSLSAVGRSATQPAKGSKPKEASDQRQMLMAICRSCGRIQKGRQQIQGFSAVFARQQVADCHPSAALLLDHNVAGLYFRLHCLTASMRRVVSIANGSAEFG